MKPPPLPLARKHIWYPIYRTVVYTRCLSTSSSSCLPSPSLGSEPPRARHRLAKTCIFMYLLYVPISPVYSTYTPSSLGTLSYCAAPRRLAPITSRGVSYIAV